MKTNRLQVNLFFFRGERSFPSPIDEQDENENADKARAIRNLFDEEAIEENEEPEVVIEKREELEEAGEEEFEGLRKKSQLRPS
jgi:hypothetical protein